MLLKLTTHSIANFPVRHILLWGKTKDNHLFFGTDIFPRNQRLKIRVYHF